MMPSVVTQNAKLVIESALALDEKRIAEEQNARAAEEVRARIAAMPPLDMTAARVRDTLHQHGLSFWTYGICEGARVARRADDAGGVDEHVMRLYLQHAYLLPSSVRVYMGTRDGQRLALAAGRWVQAACPVVRLAGHRYAAALMSTTMPSDIPVKLPWNAFVLEVPAGLLPTTDLEGRQSFVETVLVYQHDCVRNGVLQDFQAVSIVAFAGTVKFDITNYTLEELCGDDHTPARSKVDAFDLDLNDDDSRILSVLRRLVINTCLAMTAPDGTRPLGKHPSDWKRGPLRDSGEPAFRVFSVGKPITLDCRPALAEYLSGARRNPLSVQFLVRGHWRNQAHGTQRQQRKLIWIEPHWKGPEEALISVRNHTLGTAG